MKIFSTSLLGIILGPNIQNLGSHQCKVYVGRYEVFDLEQFDDKISHYHLTDVTIKEPNEQKRLFEFSFCHKDTIPPHIFENMAKGNCRKDSFAFLSKPVGEEETNFECESDFTNTK